MTPVSSTSPAPMTALKLALAARRLRTEGGGHEVLQSEPIAIIGLGCRLPGGADSPADFWRVLEKGTDAIREIPPARWDIDAFYDPNPRAPGHMNTRWAGLLDQIDQFDAEFFGIAPREAASMDPQQRLLLEVTWEALNDAGYPPESLSDTATGVFYAIYNTDYARLLFQDAQQIDGHASSGSSHGIAAGRLSYLLNLRGPSLAVDTACSSSLVAVHLACQSLRLGECNLALAGGVSTIATPEETIALSKWGMLAPDGRCKTFDASANGFVRGEGCGVIALKRLADALADGDTIHAVIRGSAVNQDGRSTVLTAPNGLAQQAVLRQALQNARIAPQQVSYVEAHGTGTALGDPIEVEALGAVIGRSRPDGSTCRLGSVKTNLGHLEAAAGIAGLIKVVLAMRHEKIPPHLHFRKLNPLISLGGTCLEISSEAAPWPRTETPRIAGVSSFGFGGTNAHVILEEPPRLPTAASGDAVNGETFLLPLSARTDAALHKLAAKWAAWLETSPFPLRDVCYTAALKRWHYEHRAAFTGATVADLATSIRAFLTTSTPSSPAGKPGKIAFVFSGHGSHWVGMGRTLLTAEPAFRTALEACDAELRPLSGWSVIEELAAPAERSRLDQTEVFQPVLFAFQTALAALWKSWGIVPDMVVGHSVGEIAAAHVAGHLSRADAARIAVLRGRLMQAVTTPGAMLAAELPVADAEQIAAASGGALTLAAINAAESITLSGNPEAIERAAAELAGRGIVARRVAVNRAFHSRAMDGCAAELAAALRDLRPSPGQTPFYSTVDGRLLSSGGRLDAAYWARNICEPVRFAAAIEAAGSAGATTFLEIGPHPVLRTALQQCLAVNSRDGAVLASIRRNRDERAALLETLGTLYTRGSAITWKTLYSAGGRCVSLPDYPWQRERHWVSANSRAQTPAPLSAWPGQPVRSPIFDGVLLDLAIGARDPEFLDDHRVAGAVTVPATGMIDLALSAARHAFGAEATASGAWTLSDLALDRALVLDERRSRNVQVVLKTEANDPRAGSFQLYSRSPTAGSEAEGWMLHASGRVLADAPAPGAATPTLAAARDACAEMIDAEAHYVSLRGAGLDFGPRFRRIKTLWRGPDAALARLDAPVQDGATIPHVVDPARLDACLQTVTALLAPEGDAAGNTSLCLPVAMQQLILRGDPATARWSYVRIRSSTTNRDASIVADYWIYDEAGTLLGSVAGLRLQRIDQARLAVSRTAAKPVPLHELVWEAAPLIPGETTCGRCIVLADDFEFGQGLSQALDSRGVPCVVVRRGVQRRRVNENAFEVRAGDVSDLSWVLDEMRNNGPDLVGHVLHAWSLDLAKKHGSDDKVASGELEPALGSILHLVRALLASASDSPPRLWMLTHGAVSVDASDAEVDPAQATIHGLAAVAALEHPELAPTAVDLSGEQKEAPASLAALAAELMADNRRELRLALRGERRYVARLRPLPIPAGERQQLSPSAASPQNYVLACPTHGVLDELCWLPGARHHPQQDEVEIEVAYAGLNFRDVLTALNVVAGAGVQLGAECAGRITAIGSDVSNLQVGDEVIAFALGGLQRYVTVPAALVARRPANVALQDAAALPVVFLTAIHAFHHVARLRAGQTVLIHAAAGGVGCAAVQLARRAGATIFGTAGSPEKRALLLSWGVQHVFNSRTLDFADEVRRVTEGRGVDVVLNSLSGDFAARSLDLVARGGVFIELGKRDLLDPAAVAKSHPGIRYASFDLADFARRDPAVVRRLFEELSHLVDAGAVQRPPVELFPASAIADAFRHMAQGRHVGKILIGMDALPSESPALLARGDTGGTVVITGGLGGLGLELARWFCSRGATRLALLGRREPDELARAAITALQAAGHRVSTHAVDVADRAALARTLDQLRRELGPLRGVIHAAGVVEDATLAQLDWSRVATVAAAKIDGSRHLDELTRSDSLEFFVLFSSAAAVLGSRGQGAYAAANAFMDALARRRRNQGRPAVSINWGAWADVGMAASLGAHDRSRLAALGLTPIPLAAGCATVGQLLHAPVPQILATPINWSRYADQFPADRCPALLQHVLRPGNDAISPAKPPPAAAASLAASASALPVTQRLAHVMAFVEQHAARALGLSAGKSIDPQRPLHELGMDSLMSVELRNSLAAALGRPLAATVLFDFPTIETLARHLAQEVLKIELTARAPDPATAASPASARNAVKELEELSEEDAEALLLRELEQGRK